MGGLASSLVTVTDDMVHPVGQGESYAMFGDDGSFTGIAPRPAGNGNLMWFLPPADGAEGAPIVRSGVKSMAVGTAAGMRTFLGMYTDDVVTFGGVIAPLLGNVTGNVLGNLTGNVNGVTILTGSTATNYLSASGGYSAVAYSGLSGIPGTFTPSAHAASHMSAGVDAIRLDELKAPTDVTTLNVSITAHGLTPKLPNDVAKFLAGDGTWVTVSSGVTDHGLLTGLGDDDHTQYALLTGRATPQQLAFGTAGSATAGYLTSTSHATKGKYSLNAAGTIVVDELNARFSVGTTTPGASIEISKSSSSADHLYLRDTGTGTPGIRFYSSSNPSNPWGVYAADNSYMSIGVLGINEALRITRSGDIGVGVTPISRMQVVGPDGGTGVVTSMTVRTNPFVTTGTAQVIAGVNGSNDIGIVSHGSTATGTFLGVNKADTSAIITDGNSGGLLIGTFNSGAGPIVFGLNDVEKMRITVDGNVGIGTTAPSARIHSLSITEQLRLEYDVSNYYSTTVSSTGGVTFDAVGSGASFIFSDSLATRAGASASNAKVGGVLFDHFVDVGNIGLDEDTLYSDTTPANTLSADGSAVIAEYAGIFVLSATATRRLRAYFAGVLIYDSTALAVTTSSDWNIRVMIVREGSTVVRCTVSVNTTTASSAPYTTYTRVTGLTLSNANALTITGEAAGVGATTDDIVAKLGKVSWASAA